MSATLVPLSACRNARRICSSVCPFFATFVSSSFSSRGPRLPLLTQLVRGSLFGFWVRHLVMRSLVPIAAASTASSDFPPNSLWQPLLHETRVVYYLQGGASLQPVGQDGQAAPLRSVLAGRKENRFNSSDSMNHAPESLSLRFVALELLHYPRTGHLILRRFQRRQHAGVGQIQNLLETASDHEMNV